MNNLALKSEVGSPSSPGFPPAPVRPGIWGYCYVMRPAQVLFLLQAREALFKKSILSCMSQHPFLTLQDIPM